MGRLIGYEPLGMIIPPSVDCVHDTTRSVLSTFAECGRVVKPYPACHAMAVTCQLSIHLVFGVSGVQKEKVGEEDRLRFEYVLSTESKVGSASHGHQSLDNRTWADIVTHEPVGLCG